MVTSELNQQYEILAERARTLIPLIQKLIVKASYERKGILHSEILFLLASIQQMTISRVLESGRARGQSTLMLSMALPGCQIVSIEFDRHSPDVATAAERLAHQSNVSLLFGNSREILPNIVKEGDIVLIDGPKGFRSVRLAIRLLMSGLVQSVFIHDLSVATPERAFVSRHFPEATFSDNRVFAETAAVVDGNIRSELPPSIQLDGFTGSFGYGYCLTNIPFKSNRLYRLLLLKAWTAGFFIVSPGALRPDGQLIVELRTGNDYEAQLNLRGLRCDIFVESFKISTSLL